MEIFNLFTCYGADVLLLALPTALLTQLLKLTLLKKVCRKALTFAPFALGTALYAAYACIRTLGFSCLVSDWVNIFGQGFAVGSAATFLYVLYEQFIRGDCGLSLSGGVAAALLEGYVASDSLEKAAGEMAAAALSGAGEEELCALLGKYAEGYAAEELLAVCRLVLSALSAFSGS